MSGRNYVYREPTLAFQRNDLLRVLTQRIAQQRTLDWSAVSERFKETDIGRRKRYPGCVLASRMSEIAFHQALEGLASEYSGRIQCDPIPDRASTQHYDFRVQNDELVVHELSQPEDESTGIDALAIVDGLPTIFECKLLKTRSRNKLLQKAANPEKIGKKVDPVREYFGKPCAYVLVLFPELVEYQGLSQFRKSGGMVVPFFMESREYFQGLLTAARKHGLWTPQLDGDSYLKYHRREEERIRRK